MRIGPCTLCGAAALALALAIGCGSFAAAPSGSKTAAERAAAERAASDEEPVERGDKSWGGWRYQGARDDCFFVVERKCFVTLADACAAAACKAGCETSGAGPATVTCR